MCTSGSERELARAFSTLVEVVAVEFGEKERFQAHTGLVFNHQLG